MKFFLKAGFLLFFCIASTAAIAKKPANEISTADSVRGELVFLVAAKSPARIDRRLLPMKKDLARAFAPKLNRFDFIENSFPSLSKGVPRTAELPGGGKLTMTYVGTEGEHIVLKMELPEWSGQVRVKNGKRFFQAGRRYNDGILVIALRVTEMR